MVGGIIELGLSYGSARAGLGLTALNIIVRLVFSACLSLTVLQLEAPAYVKLGDSLTMHCGFDLEGKTLYR